MGLIVQPKHETGKKASSKKTSLADMLNTTPLNPNASKLHNSNLGGGTVNDRTPSSHFNTFLDSEKPKPRKRHA